MPLMMSLMPPVEARKGELVLTTGADIKMDEYRADKDISIVFQIVY